MKNNHKGFTLLEILLVVGIIAILAGIVIVAINPGRQLASVRNAERRSDLKQINSAIAQFYIDNSYYPASTTDYVTSLVEICDTGATSSPSGIDCSGLVDLSELVPTYITAIPVDPQGPVIISFLNQIINTVYAATGGTGYWLGKDPTNKIILTSERAELGAVIAIGTSTVAGGETNPVENTSLLCSDSVDNDSDGDTDCIDTDCTNTEACIVASLRESLVGYWPLNETTGSVIYDYSGSNYNGTIQNNVTLNHAGPTGKSALIGNLSTDGILIGNIDSQTVNVSELTMQGWVKPIALTGVWASNTQANYAALEAHVNYGISDGWIGILTFSNTTPNLWSGIPVGDTVYINTSDFYHLAIVFDGSGRSSYVNGNLISYVPTTNGLLTRQGSVAKDFYLGRPSAYDHGTGAYNGYLSEVAIWNRALTTQEISDLYNAGNGRSLVQ